MIQKVRIAIDEGTQRTAELLVDQIANALTDETRWAVVAQNVASVAADGLDRRLGEKIGELREPLAGLSEALGTDSPMHRKLDVLAQHVVRDIPHVLDSITGVLASMRTEQAGEYGNGGRQGQAHAAQAAASSAQAKAHVSQDAAHQAQAAAASEVRQRLNNIETSQATLVGAVSNLAVVVNAIAASVNASAASMKSIEEALKKQGQALDIHGGQLEHLTAPWYRRWFEKRKGECK